MISQERELLENVVATATRDIWCTFQRDITVDSRRHNIHWYVEVTADSVPLLIDSLILRREVTDWFDSDPTRRLENCSLHSICDKLFMNICERHGIHSVRIRAAAEGENGISVNYLSPSSLTHD